MTALMEFKLKADEFNALSTCWKEKADFIHKVGYDKDFLVTNLKKLLDDLTPNQNLKTSSGYLTMGEKPSGQAQTVTEFLGIPWEEDVIDTYKVRSKVLRKV